MPQIMNQYAFFNAVSVVPFRRNLPFINLCVNINHFMGLTFQRRRCYAFDSPGLPNDSAGYPGLTYVVRGTTP